MFNVTITRETQKTDTIYVIPSGEAFISPDGEGRVWFDTLEEALIETGFTWVHEVQINVYEV